MRTTCIAAALLAGCGGTSRPTCDYGAPVEVGDDAPTSIGSARQVVEDLDGRTVVVDDGREGVLSLEQIGVATLEDHTPGQKRTGLPPYSIIFIDVACNDTLTVPVRYELVLADETRVDEGQLTQTDWETLLTGPRLRLGRQAGDPELWARLEYPPDPLY